MNVEYMRTAKKSYMVIKDIDFPYERYELKMIMKNAIPCLLPFQTIKAEGGTEYWYEVGGLQSMRNVFATEPVGEKQLRLILQNIMEMKSAMEDYLLDDDSISFSADTVYYDRTADRIRFCYVPGLGSSQESETGRLKSIGVRLLFEEILKYLDHGDPSAVRIGYEMYDRCVRAPFMVSDCVECMHMGSARPMGVRDRDLSWMEERVPASDVFKNEDDDMEFLWDTGETSPGHKKKRRKDRDKKTVTHRERTKKEHKKGKKKPDQGEVEFPDIRSTPVCDETQLLSPTDGEFGATELLTESSRRSAWELTYKGDGVEGDIIPKNFPFVVGSDPTRADGILKARTVSRVHARLYLEDGRLLAEDFNSTNGTYVNGRLLPMNTPAELKDGDSIVFGTEGYRVCCRQC